MEGVSMVLVQVIRPVRFGGRWRLPGDTFHTQDASPLVDRGVVRAIDTPGPSERATEGPTEVSSSTANSTNQLEDDLSTPEEDFPDFVCVHCGVDFPTKTGLTVHTRMKH